MLLTEGPLLAIDVGEVRISGLEVVEYQEHLSPSCERVSDVHVAVYFQSPGNGGAKLTGADRIGDVTDTCAAAVAPLLSMRVLYGEA